MKKLIVSLILLSSIDTVFNVTFFTWKFLYSGHLQPQPTLFGFEDKNLEGVKVGVDWAYFKVCF